MPKTREDWYREIINLDRPKSERNAMTNMERAAQFSPFAALTGYGEKIADLTREVARKRELSEDELSALDLAIGDLQQNGSKGVKLAIKYFVPDEEKSSGVYVESEEVYAGIDFVNRIIKLDNNKSIPLDDIVSLELVES